MDTRMIIDLTPYEKISYDSKYQHHTLIDIANIIIEKDGYYYFIEDDVEKLRDVSIMPVYIKEDWINYNKKELDYKVIDGHLKKWIDSKDISLTQPDNDVINERISLLKSIRRDLIIKKII